MSDRYDVWVRKPGSKDKWARRFRHHRLGTPRAHRRNWNLTKNQLHFRSRREKDRAVKLLKARGWEVKASLSVTPGDRIVAAARKHIGVKEQPPGSNKGQLITKWLRRVLYNQPGPWCAAYASCMAEDAGYPLAGGGSASVAILRQRAQKAGRWTQNPKRGYLGVLHGDVHITIIESVKDDISIEGNTRAADGSNHNGGEVARQRGRIKRREYAGYIKTD